MDADSCSSGAGHIPICFDDTAQLRRFVRYV